MCGIKAIFSDYDGTLAPVDVAREISRPPPEVSSALYELRKHVVIAMVSTKDCEFLIPRTPFAHAWACVFGLEVRVEGKGLFIHEEVPKWQDKFGELIEFVKSRSSLKGAFIEVKKVGNYIGGLCIDWRGLSRIDENDVNAVVKKAEELGFRVLRYKGHPFIDVYPDLNVDKAYAVRRLRELLQVNGPVMYLGDSENDEPAMRVVEYPVGVRHRYNQNLELPVLLWIREEELPQFLKRILDCLIRSK